jgi:hypothetical protein
MSCASKLQDFDVEVYPTPMRNALAASRMKMSWVWGRTCEKRLPEKMPSRFEDAPADRVVVARSTSKQTALAGSGVGQGRGPIMFSDEVTAEMARANMNHT